LQVSKTVTAELYCLTARKRALLSELSSTWKKMTRLAQTGVNYTDLRKTFPTIRASYSRNADYHPKAKDAVYLTTQDFRLIDAKKKFARWFAMIPIRAGVRVFAPLKMRQSEEVALADYQTHDSRIVERKGRFFLHLSVSKDVQTNYAYSSVLSVDLGERFLATSVTLAPDACKALPHFYGKNVRGIRRHYAWLRMRLGNKKLLRVIRHVKHKEHNKINEILHRISRDIVDEAKANNSAILLGDLKGMRQNIHKKKRGKRMNRIIANMPYHALSRMIEYKASWEGVPVIYGSEAYSSQTCHVCNSIGKRPYQGLFICEACGHQFNADHNGAMNTGKRLLDYTFRSGVLGSAPMSGPPFIEPASHKMVVTTPSS
jgi:putative transposase